MTYEPSMLLVSSWTAPELQEGTRKLARMVRTIDMDDRQDTCLTSPVILSENFNMLYLQLSTDMFGFAQLTHT